MVPLSYKPQHWDFFNFYSLQIDTSQTLENIERLRLYSYVFKYGAFGEENEKEVTKEVGLLAQEVKTVIPDAVKTMVR